MDKVNGNRQNFQSVEMLAANLLDILWMETRLISFQEADSKFHFGYDLANSLQWCCLLEN